MKHRGRIYFFGAHVIIYLLLTFFMISVNKEKVEEATESEVKTKIETVLNQ